MSGKGALARKIDDPPFGPRISPWAVPQYLDALEAFAEDRQMELRGCARKYAVIELSGKEDGEPWRYHWALGFSRDR